MFGLDFWERNKLVLTVLGVGAGPPRKHKF